MQKYTWPAILLHWLMALLVLAMLALGLYMADLPKGDLRSELIRIHKSIGITLALLWVLRVAWRLSHPPPPYPPVMPEWQRRLATANVRTIYVLLIFQPLSGYLSSSFSGYATRVFGLPLPQWGWESPELNHIFNLVHAVSARALILFISLHLAGAAWHGLVRRDGVVRRMLP
jgi:cytochrome b561